MWIFAIILSLVITAWGAGIFAKTRLRKKNPPPGKLVDVGGYKMHLHGMGDGPTVVLEAGVMDFHISWAKVQAEIAKFARVYSYDRAGLGWSETSPHPRTSEVIAEELHTLLEKAGANGPYILVGHSYGGIHVRAFARKYPNEVAGMVLVDSSHEDQNSHLSNVTTGGNGAFNKQFRTYSLMSSLGLLALLPASIPNRGFPDNAYKQYQTILATTKYFDSAIAEMSSTFKDLPKLENGELGNLPLVVIRQGRMDETARQMGLNDRQKKRLEQTWETLQKELAALSSNSREIVASDSGHYIQLDQHELVVEAIRSLTEKTMTQIPIQNIFLHMQLL